MGNIIEDHELVRETSESYKDAKCGLEFFNSRDLEQREINEQDHWTPKKIKYAKQIGAQNKEIDKKYKDFRSSLKPAKGKLNCKEINKIFVEPTNKENELNYSKSIENSFGKAVIAKSFGIPKDELTKELAVKKAVKLVKEKILTSKQRQILNEYLLTGKINLDKKKEIANLFCWTAPELDEMIKKGYFV